MHHVEAFSEAFAALVRQRRHDACQAGVRQAVAEIVEEVRRDGDAALCRLTRKLDRFPLEPRQIRLADAELDCAVDKELETALDQSLEHSRAFHRLQLRQEWSSASPSGGRVGEVFRPVDRAGIYVPGGTAPLVSTVLMSVVPAQVAGVAEICVATPPGPDGQVNKGILAACRACGVREVYRIGGAQAIAALAFGTASVRPVDVIAGPGNEYVTEAKRQVFGVVGIDLLAGPSESMIVIDETADPAWIAADILSQAEHHGSATCIVAESGMILDQVEAHIHALLSSEFKDNQALASAVKDRLVAVHATSMAEAADVVNVIAPEHLQIVTANNDAVLGRVRHAGAVFVGPYAPVPLGDFVAGPSHVLPTNGAARFMSGLSTDVFRKRMAVMECTKESFGHVARSIEAFGRAEQLPAHAYTATVRRK